ncbi:MAG TPA: hypothetical protein VGR78_06945 [Verrucomicrobiae bacterium]|jgi:hypothetical protein|nr:hypothetical protein [Verrucomicrobiae bacterium]
MRFSECTWNAVVEKRLSIARKDQPGEAPGWTAGAAVLPIPTHPVVVPVRNERGNIQAVVERTRKGAWARKLFSSKAARPMEAGTKSSASSRNIQTASSKRLARTYGQTNIDR